MTDLRESFCPRYLHAVELVGRRWTGAIIRALLPGAARFNALRDAIPDISDRMLAERLRELEAEGVLVRRVIPETPVRVEYELTDKGRALKNVVLALSEWAQCWVPAPSAAPSDRKAAGTSARSRPPAGRDPAPSRRRAS